ncbi:dehydrogenase/reductase [Poronia punctata]|nr:dehydrogenase/reductase [Poronia punctata]
MTMTYKKTILITGGTANLGYQTALKLARLYPQNLIILSSRSDPDKAAENINTILKQSNTIFLPLDLSSLENVREYCSKWGSEYPPIQALLLNAGLQFPGGITKTVDGVESTFGINHLGHALLFHLLAPYLDEDGEVSVIVTASGTHDPEQKTGLPDAEYLSAEQLAHPSDKDGKEKNGRQRYATSKLCNVLWTYALASKLKGQEGKKGGKKGGEIRVAAYDPCLMPGTGLARDAGAVGRFLWFCVAPRIIPLLRIVVDERVFTPTQSAEGLVRLVTGDLKGEGRYYFESSLQGGKERESSMDSYDVGKQEDLWGWTTRFLARDEEEGRRFEEFR